MNALRIALVAPEHPACGPAFGVGAYVAVLAAALAEAGCEVLVLACTPHGRFAVLPGRPAQRLAPAGGPAALRPRLIAGWLSHQLRAWDPQVVEYSNWGGLGAADRGAWTRVVRLSTPVAAIRAESPLRRLARPLHRRWESRTVRRAGLVIADSAAMSALSARVFGRAADAIIPHACAQAAVAPVDAGCEVLCVGRLEHRKGTDRLLCAWRLVHAARPDAVLHLVGRDHGGFGAAALARFGTAGVVAHGWLADHDLAALRARCRIQVIPSRFESFGMVALEAMAGGQAVVATPAGGLAEAVGEAGLVVADGGVRGLAQAMLRLLDDRAFCRSLAEAGARRLAQRFAPAAMAAASLAAYRAAKPMPRTARR